MLFEREWSFESKKAMSLSYSGQYSLEPVSQVPFMVKKIEADIVLRPTDIEW